MNTIINLPIVIESQYFPCLTYFTFVNHTSTIFLEENDNYQKQEYRNRCYILGANKVESLTIPVHSKNKIKYSDVTIDYGQDWLKIHLRTFKSAYANSPYFEHYYPLIEVILLKRYTFLIEVNREIMTLCLKLLGWEKEIVYSDSYWTHNDLDIKDCRNKVSVKRKDLVLDGILEGIVYKQLFGNKFVSNLSILDLLFNEGPQSSDFFSKCAYNKLV